MKHKIKTGIRADYPDLVVSSTPPSLLYSIRNGNADTLATQDINIFYVLADYLEKNLKALKEKCRSVIITRRDEGEPAGAEQQHREFRYQTPTGNVLLTIQERIIQKPDPEKLEALLRTKNLWQAALTTTLDPIKIDGLRTAGLITEEEFASVSDAPKPTYALIARLERGKAGAV